ncbi:MAG: amino acid transporter [Sphingomonas bacterium]|nr:peptide MFS transporter [Sphingomonas bacterium]MDB5689054.1 amino acid transporter [Sphingomonas bacterium]
MTSPAAASPADRSTADDRAFFGHPRGLGYLAFCEAWERFSYYGMQTLLVLYMVNRLLLPGHVENVAGFAPVRRILESAYGPLAPQPLASAIFGLYAGGVYLTPILGGWIADRVLGRTRTITLGAVLMTAGHFLMAFDVSFLIALLFLLVGVGCFKGNIASQVGELYAPSDLRRADAFQIFLLGVQIAVIVSPLVCGTLGQQVAWHWGFGAAGMGMVIGLLVYLSGRRYLPPDRVRVPGIPRQRRRLATGEGKTIAVLIALLPVLTLGVVGNQQIFNAYLIWGDANYDLVFFGRSMPVTWLVSLDAFVSTVTMAGALGFWRWWSRRHAEPDEITKILIGTIICALAPLALALASWQQAATGQKVGLGWGIAFHVLNDIGFANVLPVGLALYARAAPRAVSASMIGVYYLHLFAANMFVGWLGGLLGTMPAGRFWMLHFAIIVGSAVLLFMFRALFRRRLAPSQEAEPAPALA